MEKINYESVVSFRIRKEEKMKLENIIQLQNTNKSDFIRKFINQILITDKIQ